MTCGFTTSTISIQVSNLILVASTHPDAATNTTLTGSGFSQEISPWYTVRPVSTCISCTAIFCMSADTATCQQAELLLPTSSSCSVYSVTCQTISLNRSCCERHLANAKLPMLYACATFCLVHACDSPVIVKDTCNSLCLVVSFAGDAACD